MSEWKPSALTLSFQVPSAVPAICRIQHNKKRVYGQYFFMFHKLHSNNWPKTKETHLITMQEFLCVNSIKKQFCFK